MFKSKILKNQFVKIFNFGFAYGAGATLGFYGLLKMFSKIEEKKENSQNKEETSKK